MKKLFIFFAFILPLHLIAQNKIGIDAEYFQERLNVNHLNGQIDKIATDGGLEAFVDEASSIHFSNVRHEPVRISNSTLAEREIIGVSPFQNALWTLSTVDWSVIRTIQPTLAGFTITGLNALTFNPANCQYYTILKLTGVSGRVLATIIPETGVCTQIGNLGDNFSSITFAPNGTCYGVTGDGATVKETLYQIDITNANKTLLTPLGNGADGEVIAFNKDDGFIYHWSGNGTVIFEKIDPTTFAITNIPIIGTTDGETFGAVYDGNGTFITSNISSRLNTFTTAGVVSAPFGNNPDDLRGLAFFPASVSNATISGNKIVCQNTPFPNVTFSGSGGTLPYTFTYKINGGPDQVISTTGTNTMVEVPVPTNITGTFTYSLVSIQNSNSCTQNQAGSVTVSVNTKPTLNLVFNNQTIVENGIVTLCDNDTNADNNTLVINVASSCIGGPLYWRTQSGAGTWSDWTTTTPSSQPSNNLTYRYQASCNEAGCPTSTTEPFTLTIRYRASTPQNVSLTADGTTVMAGQSATICDLAGNALNFTATCATGEVVLYSVDGEAFLSTIPNQLVDNNFHNYRVRCQKADGTVSCQETESASIGLKILTSPPKPTVSISPTVGCGTPSNLSNSTTCGNFTTIWFNATTNQEIGTLPSTTPNETTSFYARCKNAEGCTGEASNTVTFTLTNADVIPVISASSELVCAGTQVTLSTNCPSGATVIWNNALNQSTLNVSFSNATRQNYTVKCIFETGCQSLVSAVKTITWKAFDLTLINIGSSQSGIKSNDKNAWAGQFVMPDAGPILDLSTQANPTIYHSENPNKIGPRYWTIHAETCVLGTNGSLTFDMLATPESGPVRSFNTHENNAPYLMYGNRDGFTELYAQNHPAYGFYLDNGSGGNVYDIGLPKGLYKLGVRYWDQKGQGSIYPSTRQPQGNVLAYQEYWFRIQSKDGVGVGAARIGSDNGQRITDNGLFAEVAPNPVSSVMRLKVTDAKNQKVNINLMDASGRTLMQHGFIPETNQHQEEFEVSELTNGMYFLKVNAGEKQATLKVVKVQ